jgi:endonuclease YncB( thermonuclease family)
MNPLCLRLTTLLLFCISTSAIAQTTVTLKNGSVPYGDIASGSSIVNRGTFSDQSKAYTIKQERGQFYFLSDGTNEGWVFKVSVEPVKGEKAKAAVTTFDAYLVDVLDGDTIRIQKKDASVLTIRLLGIDTPEASQAYGFEATRELKRLLTGRTMKIEPSGKDRYRRTLGVITVGQTNINLEMVKSGLAWHYTAKSKNAALANAEAEAKRLRKGLWVQPTRISPWDYRNGVRQQTARPKNVPSIRTADYLVYVTEYGSKYHRGNCGHLRKSKQPIPLSRARSAYGACEHCNPPR